MRQIPRRRTRRCQVRVAGQNRLTALPCGFRRRPSYSSRPHAGDRLAGRLEVLTAEVRSEVPPLRNPFATTPSGGWGGCIATDRAPWMACSPSASRMRNRASSTSQFPGSRKRLQFEQPDHVRRVPRGRTHHRRWRTRAVYPGQADSCAPALTPAANDTNADRALSGYHRKLRFPRAAEADAPTHAIGDERDRSRPTRRAARDQPPHHFQLRAVLALTEAQPQNTHRIRSRRRCAHTPHWSRRMVTGETGREPGVRRT